MNMNMKDELNKIEKYKDMSGIDFKVYMSEKYPNTCGRSEENERRMWTWHMFGPECQKGWWSIFEDFCEEVEKIYDTFGVGVFISQFKEKFGSPRLYVSNFYTEEAENIFNSEDSKEKTTLEIICCYLNDMVQKYERDMGELSELSGKRLPYRRSLFSHHGWVWGTTPEEIIEIYSKDLETITDEKEILRLKDIIESAKKQVDVNEARKQLKYSFEDIVSYLNKEEMEEMKNKFEEDLVLKKERSEKQRAERIKAMSQG